MSQIKTFFPQSWNHVFFKIFSGNEANAFNSWSDTFFILLKKKNGKKRKIEFE